jgi:predicted transposase YbfD/YdcC
VHLLSVFDVTTGCVRAQREIDAKTNEIPGLASAIAHLDLTGTVVTVDALHTQAETARCLAEDKSAKTCSRGYRR